MKDHLGFTEENEIDIDSEWGNEPIDDKPPVLSKKTKRRMNKIFREIAGIQKIPYPEADTLFERVRSWFIIKFSKDN